MQLSREEMETVFSFTADNRETVVAFSNDPVWIRKLERAGAVLIREVSYNTKEYTLEYRQISLRKLAPKKVMSEERKAAAGERMRTMREKRKISDVDEEENTFGAS